MVSPHTLCTPGRGVPVTLFFPRPPVIQGEETIDCVDTLGALIMPRCINWASQHGQKTRNNFLADHFSFLLLPCRVRCPKVAKNGLLERWRALFSIAIGHLGAPSNISDFPIFRRAIAPSAFHSAGNGRLNHRSRYRCLRAFLGIGAQPH